MSVQHHTNEGTKELARVCGGAGGGKEGRGLTFFKHMVCRLFPHDWHHLREWASHISSKQMPHTSSASMVRCGVVLVPAPPAACIHACLTESSAEAPPIRSPPSSRRKDFGVKMLEISSGRKARACQMRGARTRSTLESAYRMCLQGPIPLPKSGHSQVGHRPIVVV